MIIAKILHYDICIGFGRFYKLIMHWLYLFKKLGINMTFSEPHRHNQLQQVDVAIREVKR